MAVALALNPGSNSLKFDLVELDGGTEVAAEATKLASATLDDIGKKSKLLVYDGRNVTSEHDVEANDMKRAVSVALGHSAGCVGRSPFPRS